MQDNVFLLEKVNFSYGNNHVIKDLSLSIKKGKITSLIGANGCGKSTLFNLMTRNLRPDSGHIFLQNEDISQMRLKIFARKAAIVHQYNVAPGDLTVEKLVAYGRNPYKTFGCLNKDSKDEDKIKWAMDITDVYKIRNSYISDLSGGQKQRAWIAMALAQDTKTLFLDEPTTYLDIRYQLEILRMISQLNRDYGFTIIMVLHDINQAMYYSHEIVAMKEGTIIQQSEPDRIAENNILKRIYNIELTVTQIQGRSIVLNV